MRLFLEQKQFMDTTVWVQDICILKLAIEKDNAGTGELNQFVKCFLYKCEDPSSIPRTDIKKAGPTGLERQLSG